MMKSVVRPVAVLGIASIFATMSASGAHAEDAPSTEELLQKCDGADYCEFTPTSNEPFLSKSEQVSPMSPNCNQSIVDLQADWSQTKGSSDSVGGSVTASSGVMGLFEASIEINYNHTWTTTDTKGGRLTVHIGPNELGYVTRATPMSRVTGTYELHFGDRLDGHYYWFTPPVTVEGPDPARVADEVVQGHTRPMSPEETALYCS
ncbi:hypothetical protein [Aeromicrobium sp.]|uniref:hypothetical protein n=1 Tax=Aeromicrobium sp. TaxID=1871063 RepID=UPI001991D41C|nr:hypothetical protein [Aeromicrobium sp.]MBC7633391.1 hypothetical protein [Aeromicrobium sp.]